MAQTQLTKPIKNKTYSFKGRYLTREAARKVASKLNGKKHAYYKKIVRNGVEYFDVRVEN